MGDVDPEPVTDPGLEVAVNDEALAPSIAAVYVTVAVPPSTAVAVPIVGVLGIAADALPTATDFAEDIDDPVLILLLAIMTNLHFQYPL
jgi:hypothetical protein